MQLTDEAVECVKRGWWVFPCRPDSKQPVTEHGLNDASNDPSVVRAWWKEHPQANIGVSCGPSGLLVIDVDHRAGAESWRRPPRVFRCAPGPGREELRGPAGAQSGCPNEGGDT